MYFFAFASNRQLTLTYTTNKELQSWEFYTGGHKKQVENNAESSSDLFLHNFLPAFGDHLPWLSPN